METYTIKEACKELNVRLTTLYYWINTADIKTQYDTETGKRIFTERDIQKIKNMRNNGNAD